MLCVYYLIVDVHDFDDSRRDGLTFLFYSSSKVLLVHLLPYQWHTRKRGPWTLDPQQDQDPEEDPEEDSKAWFPLNRRAIVRRSATVCDRLRCVPDLMETLSYDPYDRRGSWIVSVGKVELSSTFPIVTTVPIWENFYGNTHRRRSAIIADELLLNMITLI